MDPLNIQENTSILANLPPNASVGVDKKGRLYAVTGIKKGIHKITNAWHSREKADLLQKASREVLTHLNLKRITEPSDTAEFQQLIQNVKKLALFSEHDISETIRSWYDQQYARLIEDARMDPQVAEAYVTIAMSYDPNIPQHIKEKIAPRIIEGGAGGSYFIYNRQGEKIGVFKPGDEEPFTEHNPKGSKINEKLIQQVGTENCRIRDGQTPGTGWKKEIAAYVIDKGKFANIPYTTSMTVRFPKEHVLEKIEVNGEEQLKVHHVSEERIEKEGSFQVFAKGVILFECTKDVIDEFTVEQVQRIALFDLVAGNADRNLGNLLWNAETQQLTPIDHGLTLLYSLVEGRMFSEVSCEWVAWPQVAEEIEAGLAEWVQNLNFEKLAKTLNPYLSKSSLFELQIRLNFIQMALRRGFNIVEIAKMIMPLSEDVLPAYKNIPRLLDPIVREALFAFAIENEIDTGEKLSESSDALFVLATKDEKNKDKVFSRITTKLRDALDGLQKALREIGLKRREEELGGH